VAAFLGPLRTNFSAKRFGETLLKNQRVWMAHADSGGHKLQRSSNKHGHIHDFRRLKLFSAARGRPPKIIYYFRRRTMAAENRLIFGGL
jgi:hypothetical protein